MKIKDIKNIMKNLLNQNYFKVKKIIIILKTKIYIQILIINYFLLKNQIMY